MNAVENIIYNKIFYRLNLRNKGIYAVDMANAKKIDNFSVEELCELQRKKLREFMKYAQKNTEYYKDKFCVYSVDVNASDILREIKKIPPIKKADVKKNIDIIMSSEFKNSSGLIKKCTGGSTGEPLCIWGDKEDYRQNGITIARQRNWINLVGGMRTVTLFGGFRDLPGCFNRLAKKILLNDRIINIMDRHNADYFDLLCKIRTYAPEVLIGYFSSLRELAYAAEEVGCPLGGVKVILACAEPIDEVGRSHAERWLGAKIYFQYGNRELGTFAQECIEQEGYHYAQDQTYCEILDEGGRPADYGDLTITFFGNKVVPLIRYQTGDGASLKETKCRCGLPYHRLSVIDGRLATMIELPGGGKITSNIFAHLLKDHTWIKEYQVIQDGSKKIRIIIKTDGESQNTYEISEKIYGLMGDDLELVYDFSGIFEQVPTGKHVSFLKRI